MTHFAYAKPPQFHYQTFNRHTLQLSNQPLFDKPPRPPTPVTVDPLDEGAAPPDGGGDAKDEPKEEGQDVEPSDSATVPETDAGLLSQRCR